MRSKQTRVKYRPSSNTNSRTRSALSQVRRYKITGELRKHGDNLPFTKDIKALRKEDALQHLYSDMGSRHKARRFEIVVKQIEEIPEPEAV